MRDRARYAGNSLNPSISQPLMYKPFYLMVSGHIESGMIDGKDGINCKYDFINGTNSQDWQLVEGNKSGVSQHAYKSQQTNKRVVWNYPFELIYQSVNVSGWPQIVLTLSARDWRNRDNIMAYGTCHVPTQPGTHTRYVHLFKPLSSSFLNTIVGWMTGKNAEYYKPSEVVGQNQGRSVTRVESGGTLKV
jgi:hypothetical protein